MNFQQVLARTAVQFQGIVFDSEIVRAPFDRKPEATQWKSKVTSMWGCQLGNKVRRALEGVGVLPSDYI